ncbi:hypothetical protein SOASR029_21020 [Budvicia aquatica]|nr:hypothetical protein SOASR029_21020 [Budvicia aquatica]
MMPGGTTTVTNNIALSFTQVPNEFLASTVSLTLADMDGDLDLVPSFDASAVTKTWNISGDRALTPSELSSPLISSTALWGKTLTVSLSVPVTVTSRTGIPLAADSPTSFSSVTYTVKVPSVPPKLQVNGVIVNLGTGFPKTGFIGAKFQFLMNGTTTATNSNYTYAVNPPVSWVTVDSTGIVLFTAEPPASQPVNIIIRDKTTGVETKYNFTIGTWFITNGTGRLNKANAAVFCQNKGNGYALPSYTVMTTTIPTDPTNTAGIRPSVGNVYGEWGNPGLVSSTTWDPNSVGFWVNEEVPGKNRMYVYFGTAIPAGALSFTFVGSDSATMSGACARVL